MIRFWVLPNSGLRTLPVLRDHLGRHAADIPASRIEVTVLTAASMWGRLLAHLKRPDPARPEPGGPDLIQIPSQWTSSLAALGLLEELTGPEWTDLSRWIAPLRRHCVLAGTPRVFSVPWWMAIWVLYYRKDVLGKIGIDPEASLSTWDGLARSCREIERRSRGSGRRATRPAGAAGYRPRGFPIANPNPRESVALADLAACVWSCGGDMLSSDGSHCLLHREEAFEGMRRYFELLDKGWMPLLGKSGLIPENLFDGKCAMQLWGRFPRERMSADGLKGRVGAVCVPGGPVSRSGVLTAHHLAVVRGGSGGAQAADLLRALARPEAAGDYALRIGAFPPSPDWDASAFEGFPGMRETFHRALSASRMLPNVKVTATLERIFDRSMEKLIRSVLHRGYQEADLRNELLYMSADVEYVLSLYGF